MFGRATITLGIGPHSSFTKYPKINAVYYNFCDIYSETESLDSKL